MSTRYARAERVRRHIVPGVVAAALLTAGCGGGSPAPAAQSAASTVTSAAPEASRAGAPNGVEKLSAEDVLARAKAAARKAGTVHITAQASEGTSKYTVDARAGQDNGTGELVNDGASFTVRRVGATAYLKGNAAFNQQVAGSAKAAKALTGKWVKGPVKGDNFAGVAGFVSLDEVVDGLLDPKGKVTKGEISSVDGRRTIILLDADQAPLHVALDGEPYAVRVESGPQAKAKSRIDLAEWGAPLQVQVPPAADTVDIAKLQSGG